MTLQGCGIALMELYLLQNLKLGQEGSIFAAETGQLHAIYTRAQTSIDVCKKEQLPCCNIEDMCKGLLDLLNGDSSSI